MPNRFEKAASEIAGAVKGAKASIKNLSGVFKVLLREHGEVSALLIRVKKTSDPEVRAQLFPEIREKLLSHEKGELAVVYPVLRRHEELARYAEMHESDAGNLERRIGRLSLIAYDDDRWGPSFEELVHLVKHHVGEEENTYFPQANRILGREVAEQMESRYEAAKIAASKAAQH